MHGSKRNFKPRRRRGLKKRMGWMKGFEPSASRATIWRANQLRHIHHIRLLMRCTGWQLLVRAGTPEGTRTPDLLLRRQLLYPTELLAHMERVMGIEPTRPAWKAGVLPLNYTRVPARGCTDAIRFKMISQEMRSVKETKGISWRFGAEFLRSGPTNRRGCPGLWLCGKYHADGSIILDVLTKKCYSECRMCKFTNYEVFTCM